MIKESFLSRFKVSIVMSIIMFSFSACVSKKETTEVPAEQKDGGQISYELNSVHEVNGRQGIATEGDFYWVSGSTTLTKYDKNFHVIAENNDPFKGSHLIKRRVSS